MRSLRAKLITPFIVGTLLLTVLLAGYTYTSARQAVEEAMLVISEAKTLNVSNSMNLLFRSLNSSLQGMATDPHVTDLFTAAKPTPERIAEATEWMQILLRSNEFYRDILVVDANGQGIASTNAGLVGTSFRNRFYVQKALGGVLTFGDPSVGKVTKKFSVTAAAPVLTNNGIVGALVLRNDFPKIVDYESVQTHDSKALFTALLTPEGKFVAHKNKEFVNTQDPAFLALYQELVGVGIKGGAVSYTLHGTRYVGYAKLEGSTQWLVITSGPMLQVFAPANKVGVVVLVISICFLIIISFGVIRFANGILQSLLSLISYAKKVSEGALEEMLETTTRTDELDTLHKALQRMVFSLQSMLEKTTAASKMKGEFLANMSHEIRTPLNAILGMVHLSIREGDLPPKQLDYQRKIDVAARSLLGVINDILDLSKVEAGKLTIEEVPFNLRTTLENVLDMHRELVANKGLFVQMHYQEGASEQFVGDSLRMGQVLNNLLSNAIKFTDSGGITVRCWCECPAQEEDARAVMGVSVQDTGIGMAPSVLDALFQPFMQADASISRKFGGTGLGLAISQRLVHLMGGTLNVASQQGQGTTFTFTVRLPVDATPAKDVCACEQGCFEAFSLEGKRILIAEDNTINQFILEELLAPTKATVVMVENGKLALEAVQKESFDLVLMDMQMPVMDGITATRSIRELGTEMAHTLPIIAVTANAMAEEKSLGLEAGMNDYLTKPIEPQALQAIMAKWLLA